jgi:protein-tyrosine phosphatase
MFVADYRIETPPGRLAIVPCPFGGNWLADDVDSWKAAGIDLVVSLLEPDEVAERGLHDEARLCREHAIELVSFPIPDRAVPTSRPDTLALARLLASMISEGKSVVVHCRVGIGRSSVVAACALICLGASPDHAFDVISEARGLYVPDTEEQRTWVEGFADWMQSLSPAPEGGRSAPQTRSALTG